jgi:cell division protein FtsB
MSAKKRTMLTPRGVLLGVLIGGMLFTSVYPLRHYVQYRSHIASLHKEDRALDAKIAQLTDQAAKLQTDAEIERVARAQLGMVRRGEEPFVIVSAKPVPPDVREIASSSAPRGPLFSRWWHAVRATLRAIT